MKASKVFSPIILLLVKWSGIAVTDGRGKVGGTVLSKSRGGATARNKVTPINRGTAAQSQVRAIFGSFAQTWRTLTQAQRNAWNALGNTGLTFTNIFGDVVRQTGSNLYVGCNLNLNTAGASTISNAPSISDSAAGVTGIEPLADVSATELFAKTGFVGGGTVVPANNRLLVLASPKLSPGVSFVQSQLRVLTDFAPAVDTATENIWTLYTAKYGEAAVGDNIVLRTVTVRTSSGFAGVGVQAPTTISA